MAFLKRVESHKIPPAFLKGLKGDKGDRGLDGKDGRDGKDAFGSNGRDGVDGKDGIHGVGAKGERGLQGLTGPSGPTPKHQVSNGEIRFQTPEGLWGEWVGINNVTSRSGGGGGQASEEQLDSVSNTYTKVTVPEFTIRAEDLNLATNIFGVDYPGEVVIFLPDNIDSRAIIVINDESANAGNFNIFLKKEA